MLALILHVLRLPQSGAIRRRRPTYRPASISPVSVIRIRWDRVAAVLIAAVLCLVFAALIWATLNGIHAEILNRECYAYGDAAACETLGAWR